MSGSTIGDGLAGRNGKCTWNLLSENIGHNRKAFPGPKINVHSTNTERDKGQKLKWKFNDLCSLLGMLSSPTRQQHQHCVQDHTASKEES